jgi:hypothetical protein
LLLWKVCKLTFSIINRKNLKYRDIKKLSTKDTTTNEIIA